MASKLNRSRRLFESEAARPLILIVAVFVLWELVIRVFRIPPYLIPTPWTVAKMLVAEWPRLWRESLYTRYATLGGFALSILLGIPIAMVIAYSRTVESFVYPLLVFSQSVPKIAIAPLFVVWFGFGIFPKVISAFLLGFFPVVVSTVMGFKSVEPDMIDLARSMRRSRAADVPQVQPAAGAARDLQRPQGVGDAGGGRCRGRRVRRLQFRHRLRAADRERQFRPAADVRRAVRAVDDGRAAVRRGRPGRGLMMPWHASQRPDRTVATA